MAGTIRLRTGAWFSTGAVLATAATLMFVNAWRVDAAPGDTDSTLVQITPCRLVDTRQPGGTPLGPGETRSLDAHGTNGGCTIPPDAVGLSMNVTADGATAPNSFLTVWNEDAPRPNTSSLNPAAGQTPTPNAVTTGLSGTGKLNVYNHAGSVNVIFDINGYYIKSSLSELASRMAAVEAEVAALDAAQPFTVTSELIELVNAQTTPTEIRSVTVTAPVAGHVATIASGGMIEPTDGHFVQCGLTDSVTAPPVGVRLLWESPTGGDRSHLSASRVFDIAAGATATYYLVCTNLNAGTTNIFSPQVTAIFTPAP